MLLFCSVLGSLHGQIQIRRRLLDKMNQGLKSLLTHSLELHPICLLHLQGLSQSLLLSLRDLLWQRKLGIFDLKSEILGSFLSTRASFLWIEAARKLSSGMSGAPSGSA